ncbi:GRIP and coiled-coil domain-containing protein 1-like isoform X4 [Dysidea avara]|uniref:GRIP and coiled-coil domain-containing protein 1-like isoform X4 n=1 Tax=Dysidea avara TaxID=196820 RepID=UPI0033168D89
MLMELQSLLIREQGSKEDLALKEEHLHVMAREQSRVSEVEDRLQQQALREEQLVISLENKVSSLSNKIGEYERQHDQDKTTIQKLKERVCLSWIKRTPH